MHLFLAILIVFVAKNNYNTYIIIELMDVKFYGTICG